MDKGGDARQHITLLRSTQKPGGGPDERPAVVPSGEKSQGLSTFGQRAQPAALEKMGHLLEVSVQIGPREGEAPAWIDADHSPGIDPRLLLGCGCLPV